jgi:hypothetical protein
MRAAGAANAIAMRQRGTLDKDQIEPLGQGVAEGEPILASRHRCLFREGQSALLGALGLGPPTQGAGDGNDNQVEAVADQLIPLQ